MTEGPAAGLALLEPLDKDERIAGHFRIDAVRGHLHERAGNREAAIKHYQAAADRTSSIPERNYLLMRATQVARLHFTRRRQNRHGEHGFLRVYWPTPKSLGALRVPLSPCVLIAASFAVCDEIKIDPGGVRWKSS